MSLDKLRWFVVVIVYSNYEVREMSHIRRKRKLVFVDASIIW